MHPFVQGLLFGFIFLFSLGPAFFALIQTSIQQGFGKAIFLAFGVSLSDIFYILIVLFGFAELFDGEEFKFWIAICGSILLFGYALFSWFRKPMIFNEESSGKESSGVKNFFKGLLLNGLNPFIIVFWATWVGAMTARFELDFNQQVQFFGGMLLTILCSDICKAFVAHKLNHLVTIKFVRRMNRSIAVVLLVFSVQLIYYLFQHHA